ncbi:MAG: HNH endonuclease signature motif containing protein [Verrucomicrobiota bacterium]
MDLLAYWRFDNYRHDLDDGAGYNFNSKQPRLHTVPALGDTVWLFTRIIGTGGQTEYRILASLVVQAKTINPPSYGYGPFRVWGDVKVSRYYRVTEDSRQDAFELIRLLPLDSGSFRDCTRETLPQATQTMRAIKPEASRLLRAFCEQLPAEDRAVALLDDRELESALVREEANLDALLRTKLTGISPDRLRALSNARPRNRQLVSSLNELYSGRCQLCSFDSPTVYGVESAEAHHIQYLSRGGDDVIENLVLVCPNHHTVIHNGSAHFDYGTLRFIFTNGRVEPLCMNEHLEPRAAA